MSEFIFMLTHNDQTVPNAFEVYEEIRESGVQYVGFKDVGASEAALLSLTQAIHSKGQFAVMEIVSQSRETELASARTALRLGVDYLFGGRHADHVSELLSDSAIRYFPFCGETQGHPTRLLGSIAEIVADAERLSRNPRVNGLDLLAYRSSEEVAGLISQVCEAVSKPIVVAGSIDSFERIATVERYRAWGFTIGSAIFEDRFRQDSACQQVIEILHRHDATRVPVPTGQSAGA